MAAVAVLFAATRPVPYSDLERHWLVLAAHATGAAVLLLCGWLLAGQGLRRLIVVSAPLLAFAAVLAHPVCVPIPEDQRPAFEAVVALEVRAARGEPFCKLGGKWYQCKSFVSRALYF